MSELKHIRKEVLLRGPERLLDYQLLGLVLSDVDTAREVELHAMSKNAASPTRRAQLAALAELARRMAAEPVQRGKRISCSADISATYRSRLSPKSQEHFIALALNNKNQILAEIQVSIGTVNEAPVRPAEVYRSLVESGAVRCAFVHNHPSGDPTPSPQDIALLRRLMAVGELLDVPVLDFLVVGAGGYVSARDMGLMPKGRKA